MPTVDRLGLALQLAALACLPNSSENMTATARRAGHNMRRWRSRNGVALDRRGHVGGEQGLASIESLQAPAGSRLR